MEAINRQGTRLLAILGKKTERINVSVGPEQEYFLIDTAMYEKERTCFTPDARFSERARQRDKNFPTTISEPSNPAWSNI